jgi:hypothetical protein
MQDIENGCAACVTEPMYSVEVQAAMAETQFDVVDLPNMPSVLLDKDVAAELPSLTPVEKAKLTAEIVEAGKCYEPVKVWANPDGKNYVIDGFARIAICQEKRLPLPNGELVEGIPSLDAAIQKRIDYNLSIEAL